MNNAPSPIWTHSTTEVNMTGTWRSQLPDYQKSPSPCHNACPVNGNIATWIQQVKAKDYYAAWLTLMDNNPFPAIAGRVCHHPCETPCNRKELDEPVAICSLERFVGDIALQEKWEIPVSEKTKNERVAVVGGGPSGLSAAYQLRRKGYSVTLLESNGELGGLMRYGIPAYRLSKSILDGEIQRIIDSGIEVRRGVVVQGVDQLKKLRSEFDAVYVAIGAGKSKPLPGLDYSQDWVVDSAEFLAASHRGESLDLGHRLVVVGGGSAAMDVARTGRRLGKEVVVLSLEPESQLPAQQEEVMEAQEEAVEFIDGSMLKSVEATDRGLLLHCIKVNFEPGDRRGQFTITPIDGTEFSLEASTIVPAIGQDVEIGSWKELTQSEGAVIRTDTSYQTRIDGVFAGGDFTSMDRFVTQAIGMGKQAAKAIDRYLEKSSTSDDAKGNEVGFGSINTHYHSEAGREVQDKEALEVRLAEFVEVQRGLTVEQALVEAGRCFSCGSCIFCDNCYYYCPDMAIIKLPNGYEVKTDYCKGCGLCAAECPTGTIVMREGM